MPISHIGFRPSKRLRTRFNKAIKASGENQTDIARASLGEFLNKHKTPAQIHAAVMRSLRRAD